MAEWDPKTGTLVASAEPIKAPSEVAMLNPSGKPVYVSASDYSNAKAQGYTDDTPEMAAKRAEAEKYNSPVEAAALGAARGLTFGASDVAARVLGQAEEVKKIKEYNPKASTVGNIGGAVAGAIIPLGLGAKLAGWAKALTGLAMGAEEVAAARAAAEAAGLTAEQIAANMAKETALRSTLFKRVAAQAVEGAAYGAAETVSQTALKENTGSAQDVAGSLLMNVPLGAILGAGTQLGIEGISSTSGRLMSLIKGTKEIPKDVSPVFPGGSNPEPPPGAPPSAGLTEAPPGYVKGTDVGTVASDAPKKIDSMQELLDLQKQYAFSGPEQKSMIQQRLLDIKTSLPDFNFPPTNLHIDLLAGDLNAEELKAAVQALPGPKRDAFLWYNRQILNESEKKFVQTIGDESTVGTVGSRARKNVQQSGKALGETIVEADKANRAEEAKLFAEIDKAKPIPKKAAIPMLVDRIAESSPEFAGILNIPEGPEGKLVLDSWNLGSSLSRSEHVVMQDVVDTINAASEGKGFSIKTARNINTALGKAIGVEVKNGGSAEALSNVKNGIKGFIEDAVHSSNPSADVREAFRTYAINRSNLDAIQKALGGSLSEGPYPITDMFSSEDAIRRLFTDGNKTELLKKIIGPKAFDDFGADYVYSLMNKADKTATGRATGQLGGILKSNETDIVNAVGSNTHKRLTDINDLVQLTAKLPDINHSGTAKTLAWQKLLSADFKGSFKEVTAAVQRRLEATASIEKVNESLAGRKTLDTANKRTVKGVIDGVKSFFENKGIPEKAEKALKTGVIKGGLSRADIRDLSSDPAKLVDVLSKNTANLASIDPEVHQEMVARVQTAVNLLGNSLPKQTPPGLGDKPDEKISKAQESSFNKLYSAINEPMSILTDLKSRIVSPEAVVAVSMVHPELYSFMCDRVIDKLTKSKGKLPFSDLMQVSMFLQQPVSSLQSPKFILAMQSLPSTQQMEDQDARQKSIKPFNVSGAQKTDMQRILSREG